VVFLVNCPGRMEGYVVKVTRTALSIPLVLLVGIVGAVGTFSLFLAAIIYGMANWVYGGSLSRDVMDWHLSRDDKRSTLPTDLSSSIATSGRQSKSE
jgi:hypothetical protein